MKRAASVLVICLSITGNLHGQEIVQPLRDVEVKVFLIDVSNIDTVSQSFTANMTLTLRWLDPGLAHEGPDSISRSLTDVWHPRIQIINQQRLVQTLPMSVEIRPGGEVIYRQRYWGSFSQALDLHAFPFDSQKLQIRLANIGFGTGQISLIPSHNSGISDTLTLPDWEVTSWDISAVRLPFDMDTAYIDGMVFSVNVERDGGYFIYTVILPLVLIVMMSWLAFWIDPSLVASQISLAMTAMLTMIAYRFVFQEMMPRLAFLTSLDYFVLGSTLMVFLSLLEVVCTAHLSTHDRLDQARRVDRIARWLAPVLYVVIALETHYFRAWF